MASRRVRQVLSELTDGSVAPAVLPGRLVAVCVRTLPVTGAGLVLTVGVGSAGTVAVSDAVAATLEEVQFALGEGPSVDCVRSGRPVLVPDLHATGPARWPGYADGVLATGVRAVFALPLRVGAVGIGVLSLYRDRPGLFSEEDLGEALIIADAATAVLLGLQADNNSVTWLDDAMPVFIPVLDDHAEVHQATGVISVREGVSQAQALVMLQARAYALEHPISQVAWAVLAGPARTGHGEDGADLW